MLRRMFLLCILAAGFFFPFTGPASATDVTCNDASITDAHGQEWQPAAMSNDSGGTRSGIVYRDTGSICNPQSNDSHVYKSLSIIGVEGDDGEYADVGFGHISSFSTGNYFCLWSLSNILGNESAGANCSVSFTEGTKYNFEIDNYCIGLTTETCDNAYYCGTYYYGNGHCIDLNFTAEQITDENTFSYAEGFANNACYNRFIGDSTNPSQIGGASGFSLQENNPNGVWGSYSFTSSISNSCSDYKESDDGSKTVSTWDDRNN